MEVYNVDDIVSFQQDISTFYQVAIVRKSVDNFVNDLKTNDILKDLIEKVKLEEEKRRASLDKEDQFLREIHSLIYQTFICHFTFMNNYSGIQKRIHEFLRNTFITYIVINGNEKWYFIY